MRGRGAATRRRLVGGGPSVRTWISPERSGMSYDFRGVALPEVVALALGDGYRLETSMAGEGGEGDCERTERGDDGGDAVERLENAMVAV